MSDPIQVEPTVPAGSGDPDFDAALLEAGGEPAPEPVADPEPEVDPVAPEPVADPDFTFATLENGQREMRLATGQVYRGKDDAELYGQLAKAQIAASRRITELSRPADPIASIAQSVTAQEPEIDATAAAIADLMAPRFGFKDGAAMAAALSSIQSTSQAQQEYMAAQRVNMEAANFFRAVPEFSKAQADADKIDAMCQANGWAPTAANFEAAYHTLKARGEMTVAPVANRAVAPKNNMPAPPVGTAPANTGKGAPTTADLYAMTTDQLADLLGMSATQ